MIRNSLAVYLFVLALAANAFTQTTEFTYQGHLRDSGLSPTANYDLQFRLWDSETGGGGFGVVTRQDVPVSNGIFTVALDFGNLFTGPERWLEISIRPAGSTEQYLTLTGRQRITSTPYAIKSLNADTAASASNSTQLGGVPASEYVVTTDPRMSDARPPTTGSGNYIQNTTGLQATSNFNISGTGRASILDATTHFSMGGNRFITSFGSNTSLGIGLFSSSGQSGIANTFVGTNTGRDNSTGGRNSYFGASSGMLNTTGADNTMIGYDAGSLTNGSRNTYIGSSAGRTASGSPGDNVFIGYNAGTQSGSTFNTFVGSGSGSSNTGGFSNTYLGGLSGASHAGGNNNSAFGARADFQSNSLSFATAIGAGSIVQASNTIALGRSDGSDQVRIPGNAVITGTSTFGGDASFSGSGTFAGSIAVANNANINGNAIVGGNGTVAGNFRVNGNLSIGADSPGKPFYVSSGPANMFIGTCGTGGSIIGISLGGSTAGSNCSDLNFYKTPETLVIQGSPGTHPIGGFTELRSGNGNTGVRVISDGRVFVHRGTGGNTDVCLDSILTFASCSSSIRYKQDVSDFQLGLDILRHLRPTSFTWKDGGKRDFGLIAEEVAEIEPLLVTYNENGKVEGVKYDRIGVLLVNVAKEQQAQIDVQKKQIDELKAIVCEIKPNSSACRK